VEAVPVSTGRNLGDVLEVRGEGLKAGDRLVLAPPDKLQAGGLVSVAAVGAAK
jgi:HlyD family secretion protein